MHRKINIALTYLNCHEYLPFVMVFLSLTDMCQIANFLFVCSQLLVVTGFSACMITSNLKVKEGNGLIKLVYWLTRVTVQTIFLMHMSSILDAKVLYS